MGLLYLYSHYAFASLTAHVTALYPAFLAGTLATGAPPMLAALLLAFFSNLDAGITHYGTGSAPIFFGAGYVSQAKWWKLGFLISLVNVFIWFVIGSFWWKAIGLF
jgi:DASS family divalent anion:Na+ symporter